MTAYFSIQPLKTATIANMRDEVIEICLVLNGSATILNGESVAFLEKNDLYWVRHNRYRVVKVDEAAEGYVIYFNKALLEGGSYCSFIAAFCPLLNKGELIKLDDSFLNVGRALCEMMVQEYACHSDFKLQVLSGLLGIFLLHLIRRSDIVMYVSDGKGRQSYGLVS